LTVPWKVDNIRINI